MSTWSSLVTEAEADRERPPVCPRGRRWLQKLRLTESGRLCVQVTAYLDNMIDVAGLLEDSDTKNAALEQVSSLEDDLSHVRLTLHLTR